MITAIIVLCVAVAVLAVVLVIRKDKNKDNDDKFIPTIDSDSGEIGTGSNYSGGQQGIRIPGYPSITVDAGKDNVTMNLFNPEGNHATLHLKLFYLIRARLYTSQIWLNLEKL